MVLLLCPFHLHFQNSRPGSLPTCVNTEFAEKRAGDVGNDVLIEDYDTNIADDIAALRVHEETAASSSRGADKSSPSNSLEGFSSLEEDEDLLAPMSNSSASERPIARRREPWREPMFVSRSQEPEKAAEGEDGNEIDISEAPIEGDDSVASSAPTFPPAPRMSMPELYEKMPLDPVTRILEAARRSSYDSDDDLERERNGPTPPPQGTGVDYCVFCFHGTSFLRADNSALLAKFISERGSVLPKRFTRCCAKHQRK